MAIDSVEALGSTDDAFARSGLHVVVDVEEHTVSLRDGRREIWTTLAGTGTGLRLESDDRTWNFNTPTGRFTVQHSELNPVWNRPDWYFRQRDLDIPPPGSSDRRDPGALGHAAVYLSRGLAIHGTYLPELLGRAVSHGCIRIPNEYAVRLHHAVRRGTPVFIEGEAQPIERAVHQPPVNERPPWNGVGEGETYEWIDRLDEALQHGGGDSWVEPALRLVSRAVENDDLEAAEALLIRGGGRFADHATAVEFASYVVHFYDRRSATFLHVADELPTGARLRVVRNMVIASLRAFGGPMDGIVPWPSERLPSGAEASSTYELIRAAEAPYRVARRS